MGHKAKESTKIMSIRGQGALVSEPNTGQSDKGLATDHNGPNDSNDDISDDEPLSDTVCDGSIESLEHTLRLATAPRQWLVPVLCVRPHA